ncbi:deoxyguanosinetriphosphate triphosphohydrolase family protein [Massilimicrobiota sp. SW1139]|uniref:deoxyguanosinetriphosphate triphosphohydrolase family protein n=1 Tax=Massilimicrobiota sp. SW1139 TaxID=2530043 RepID=UPI00143AABFC|nr:HD domain-containing protein [Massilimicrobiota sp. SW1139]NJE45466.1 HD domain-containing protein [Massilimicrobiota sp. SW1139]
MEKQKFSDYGMFEGHSEYELAVQRCEDIYQRRYDLRSDFARDYTRIIFSQAYRRLKHKTQVFFAVEDDHVCTRSEHVNLVESISYTIAHQLGLNTELTKAIAVGHDLGHAPFGHGGETILTDIAKSHDLDKFWHEKNSLHFVDHIELLEDNNHYQHNLNLTYAVRDGIISHCGEMNQKYIQRRKEYINLNDYQYAGQYNPWTYEGCVVKMADKIAYLARDIEDALRLNVLTQSQIDELRTQLNQMGNYQFHAINNGSVVNYFIHDVVENSCVEKGIGLSQEAFDKMKFIMKFNYQNIYLIKRVQVHEKYVSLILHSIFDFLYDYKNHDDFIKDLKQDLKQYPKLIGHYLAWLEKYAVIENYSRKNEYHNHVVYDFIHDSQAFEKSIIDYLAGMSDAFIIQLFNELISF